MNTQHDRPSTPPRFHAWKCIGDVDRARVAARIAASYMTYGHAPGLLDAITRS